mgnify:CR=1 FL=1|tara:strand:+ start:9664 stop:10185 length:522 start_codon:yes stop_codon:yes gene_type:complete
MSIYKQLLEVQKEVGAISKDSKNPFFKSKYFDINKLIEVVNPVLSKHGLVLLQPIEDNKVYSRLFDAESEKSVESWLELPNLTDPQKIGSAISYYRRYTLSSLLGLQAEDEDGNGLKAKPKPVQKPIPKDFDGLLNAIANPDLKEYNKEWALKEYTLTQTQIENINKLELIKK